MKFYLNLLIRSLLSGFLLLWCLSTNAQTTSNKGRDFWIGYMAHIQNESGPDPPQGISSMNLYVTSDVNTNVKVAIGQGTATTYPVTANSVTVVPISPAVAYVGSSEVIENKAIHVTAEAPVVVYSHIYHLNKSGATLVLPANTLGRSYYAISYHQTQYLDSRAASQLMVVALEDNTTIEITPTATTLGGQPAGKTFSPSRPLKKGEVYQVRSMQDLTGTKIESVDSGVGTCKRIAVFSGSSYTAIPEPYNCSEQFSGDNLYQQLYPVSAWGKNFMTAPFKSRTSGEIYRVLASKDNTVITVNGNSVSRNSGQYFEFENTTANYITASEPVQVTQYTKSQMCDEIPSDPEMVLINPVEQTLKDITLYSSPFFQISSHYINVTMKTADIGTFRLDGRPVSFTPVPANPAYSYAQNSVSAGNHTLTADSGFNALAYGLGNFESYAYSAGANVTNLNQNITVASDSICDGRNIRFKGFAIYQPLAWKWYFGDGSTSSEQNPSHSFAKPGQYTVSLVTTKSNGNDCDSQDSTSIEVEVFPTPEASLSYEVACTNDSTRFRDESKITTGDTITGWRWDFGDGTFSDKQHPAHRFKNPGTYNVKLTVTSKNLCVADTTRQVILFAPPVAKFSAPETCDKEVLLFQDQTTVAQGKITRWEWDFGDGTPRSTEQHPRHVFPQVGTYTVKLKTFSEQGCSDSTQQTVTINPKPVAAFTLPDLCVRDEAAFQNQSTVPSGTITYRWDFGDGSTSTAQAPRHRYTAEGEYTVKLVVTSGKGCQDSVSHTYTISGAVPVPNFTATSLCQEQGVTFQDASSIAFGKIIRRQWTFGDGTTSEEINPTHLYSAPGTYQVKLSVWSGIVCTESITKTLIIKPNPAASFTVQNVCEGSRAQFTNTTQARGSGALSFTWNFGDGTNSTEAAPSHLYAAPGTYTVSLAVKGANECEQTFSSTITVYPAPKPDFSPTVGCAADVVSFQDMTSLVSGRLTQWTWDFGDGTTATTQHPTHRYGREGSYTVRLTATSDLGCVTSISKTLSVSPAPLAQAGPDQLLCGSVTAKLEANVPSPATGQWTVVQGTGGTFSNAASPSATFTGTMGGTYVLRWTVSNSPCVNATDDVEIRLKPIPQVEAGPDILLIEGESTPLKGSGQGKLTWSPGTSLSNSTMANPMASPTTTTRYYLNTVSDDGCPNQDSMLVTVIKRLQVPTAFSPNGDGSNDTWVLEGIQDYPRITIEIYNRWGQQVYSSQGYPSPWDGKRNGADLPIGAYYYIIDPHNGRPKMTGPLTILR
ncbi:gliding motility-associated C-terminal domain-containing protein [Rufibacter latericius]|uniref:PKD domain-containing protein n=1 Tax=Rufibacter latericius TaxID=2487040 RepID=A0A3M9N157_9BACT|nr:gliding motility-associated C-terminal domain-containing protein [Rufibacter latericius]RNI31521.1 PKD domain-containing protein [Rufibacter latericius]